jgi:hypothetical protein
VTKAVVLYRPASQRLAAKDMTSSAADAINTLVRCAAAGDLTPRRAKRLTVVLEHAARITDSIVQIAEDNNRMAAAAAAAAREVAQCEADIAAYEAAAADHAAKRAEAEERATLAPAVVKEEMNVRSLTARVQAAELKQRLDALTPATADHAQSREQRSATPSIPPSARDASEDALLARLSGEAASVLREVQAGVVLFGARHPYHAFAGCIYLRARLDGDDAHAAAMRARGELIAHMREDHEFSPAERKAFHREYGELKKRLDAKADARQGATLLSMMQHVGAASAPGNGNGAP